MPEDIQGLKLLLDRIREMERDVRHADRALAVAGEYGVGSVQRNFEAEGRPQHWSPLAPATIRGRRKGRGRGGPRILQDTRRLAGGVHKQVVSEGVKIATSPLAYARRQQEGYDPAGKKGPGQVKTPARKYLMLQEPEDIVEIGKIFRNHIARK
ncbi:MAG TPA: phage virion morphogenesis protein [Pyrinomonadaceae bacterium]|jgi:phage gpG-like protein